VSDLRVKSSDMIINSSGKVAALGFIDIHTHSGYIYDVWNATPTGINKLADRLLKMITFAPELENSDDIKQYCLKYNILPTAGHSNATREQIKNSKVSHITLLYNAQRGLQHRGPRDLDMLYLKIIFMLKL
jgi:N-acetylglucosamine-6-phosphate deacetylase